ncbi:MAG: MAPEG family protein [Alphaproteobacteria bacterium]|nr:MAPEG family protein [Alphaproteobacteria bacterium]
MNHASWTALIGLCAWTLFLLVLMEGLRARLVVGKEVAANAFKPDNANLSPFMQRLARAHANCIESLPVFGALLLAALVAGRPDVTDPLALWLLGARVVQSTVHLASLSVVAVNVRFMAFAVQVAIAVWWTIALLKI